MWNNSSGSEPNLKINNESDFYLQSYEIKVVEVETCTPPRKAGLTFCQNIASEFTERQSPWWTKGSSNLGTLRQSTMNPTGSMCWGTSTLIHRYDFQYSCFFLSQILLFQVGKKFIWSNCIHSKGYKPHGQHELYSIPGYDLYNAGFGICDKLNRFFFILSVAT